MTDYYLQLADEGWLLWPETGTPIVFHTTHEYTETVQKKLSRMKSIAGGLNNYHHKGGVFRYSLPLSYVSETDREQVREWWLAGTRLTLYQAIGIYQGICVVKIINKEDPFRAFEKLESDKFQGILFIESIEDLVVGDKLVKGRIPEGPWLILDDPEYGKLDTYRLG